MQFSPARVPGKDGNFIVKKDHPVAVLRVVDASDMSEQQISTIKRDVVNYSTTEVAGKYLIVTIEELDPAMGNIPEGKLVHDISELLLSAADYVHDTVVTASN